MPRFPGLSPILDRIPGSVYSSLVSRLATHPGPTYPLHVGDTWREPPVGCRMQDLTVAAHPGMHRYATPRGLPALLEVISDRQTRLTGIPTLPENLLMTGGATGGVATAIAALTKPGDEVLVLAPHWPLVPGIAHAARAIPVPVPFMGTVRTQEDIVPTLERFRTERTTLLYVNSPNNPTGMVLPRGWLEIIVGWAKQHHLWILSDEVYEDYAYEGHHTHLRSLDAERTVAAHSFSKAYGMAGNRCGYLAGPTQAILGMMKLNMHSLYSSPTASQLAALEALSGAGDAWVREVAPGYAAVGREMADRLGEPRPQGGTFLFIDVRESLDERGLNGLLDDCVSDGLLVAPGPSFGPYPTHIRLCFSAMPPEKIALGVALLARHLGR